MRDHREDVSGNNPVVHVLDRLLAPVVRWAGERVERRARRELGGWPEPTVPTVDLPEWIGPALVAISFVAGLLLADPDQSERERAEPEPEAEAERCPDPSASDGSGVEDALDTLGVEYPPVPDRADVRAAYRSRAVETHPDQGGDAERFIAVREAWLTLSEREELSGEGLDMEVTQES